MTSLRKWSLFWHHRCTQSRCSMTAGPQFSITLHWCVKQAAESSSEQLRALLRGYNRLQACGYAASGCKIAYVKTSLGIYLQNFLVLEASKLPYMNRWRYLFSILKLFLISWVLWRHNFHCSYLLSQVRQDATVQLQDN